MDEIGDIVRIGTVMNVDIGNVCVRVKFQDEDFTSDWLPVLQHSGAPVAVSPASDHGHSASLGTWLPKVNDTVLCLYLPLFSADGFVLGGIAT